MGELIGIADRSAGCAMDMAGGRLFVDLAAIRWNYLALAQRVAPAALGAVVKANAYGLGALPVVRTLAAAGCDRFFFAHLSEALAVRGEIPAAYRLYVLNGLMPGGEELCADTGIVPVLNSVEQARRWQAVAQARGVVLPAVVQFDSGMSRLGVSLDEGAALAGDAGFSANVAIDFVMSHLACADEPDHAANPAQRELFTRQSVLFPGKPRALANSGGVFLDRGFHADIVRPGIALYGGAPNPAQAHAVRPVVQLDARIIQLRTLQPDAHVGYGYSHRVTTPSRIATIAVGYADGWPRSLGNKGAAYHAGIRLPIVGRVSMDSITIDISALPEWALAPGDWVELLGPSQSIDQVAADAGTISYEILTSLGQRYDRFYRDGGVTE